MEASLTSDPLDRDDFDVISFINNRFPNENDLQSLDTYVAQINSQMLAVNDEISRAIQAQTHIHLAQNGGNTDVTQAVSTDIHHAKTAMEALCDKISGIKTKAQQSEHMVQEICADIKKLDFAKQHLQTTISQMRKLQMLVTAVQQLEELSQDNKYREAADMLEAVKQLMTLFNQYSDIPKIRDIQARVKRVREQLSGHIDVVFGSIGRIIDTVADLDAMRELPGETANQLRLLADSCLVIDALGHESRERQIKQLLDAQLSTYDSVFSKDKEYSTLQHIERRYSWFKRLLRNVDDKFRAVFPTHWGVPHRLCVQFLERTQHHLTELFSSGHDASASDVTILLKALQVTVRFEQEMAVKFEGKESDSPQSQSTVDFDEHGNVIDPESAEGIRRKYAREAAAKQAAADQAEGLQLREHRMRRFSHMADNGPIDEDLTHTPLPKINGIVSNVFDSYLMPYVVMERKNLKDMLEKVQAEENLGTDGKLPVYSSSMNMFVFMKNSMKRCVALSTGWTFLNLSKEFKTSLQQYALYLRNKCNGAVVQSMLTGQPNAPIQYRFQSGGARDLCYAINTAEYCAETVPQLQTMIQQKISPAYGEADEVEFTEEVDAFHDLVAHAIKTLVSGMEGNLDPAIKVMQSINWGGLTMVGEESSYVHQCHDILRSSIPGIREVLSSMYFKSFCDKFASQMLGVFTNVIMRQRKITEAGTQQLLLDVYSIKTILLQLHRIGLDALAIHDDDPSTRVPHMYTKFVNGRVNQIEVILKLIATPEDMLVERFRMMWPGGEAKDLQSIMNLKGMRKADQQTILESLGLHSRTSSGEGTDSPIQSPDKSAFKLPTMPNLPNMNVNMSNIPNVPKNLSSSVRNFLANANTGFGNGDKQAEA